jgi:small GTP-binding protein
MIINIAKNKFGRNGMKRHFSFKIAVIGDVGVGKTSLINQFISRKFEKDYISTIGVNILLKDLDLVIDETDYLVQLMLWDIGGQEKYTQIRHMFYQGANGTIIVYDITRPASFLIVPDFLQDLEEFLQRKIPLIILGNKLDLKNMRRVEKENGEKLMETTGAIAFFESSAKTGENVEQIFEIMAETCLREAIQ